MRARHRMVRAHSPARPSPPSGRWCSAGVPRRRQEHWQGCFRARQDERRWSRDSMPAKSPSKRSRALLPRASGGSAARRSQNRQCERHPGTSGLCRSVRIATFALLDAHELNQPPCCRKPPFPYRIRCAAPVNLLLFGQALGIDRRCHPQNGAFHREEARDGGADAMRDMLGQPDSLLGGSIGPMINGDSGAR